MIPILYEGTETAFTSNGLGRLADAISCKVVEERNATYELEMTYPLTGIHFSDLKEGRIILAQPHDGGLTEPFEIYRIEKPLNGICTIRAEHISYRLCNIVEMPFTAGSIQEVFSSIPSHSASSNPFNFTTDKVSSADYTLSVPMSVRGMLGGESGSILDVYGKGDYEFSRWDVILHQNRGSDNGVTLRYGKNITDLKNVIDMTNVYTGIVPYWTNGEQTVTLTEKVVLSTHVSDYPFQIIKPVDFSGDYEEAPTESQLRAKAQNYVTNNEGWKLKNNITVSFVALWNTEEYKYIAALERVQMCDVVHVKYEPLGIDFTTKVVRTDYDVLQERYNAITLGDTYYTLNSYFDEEITASEESQTTHMEKAIARATKLIQGGLGGHVVFNVNADGEPQEILIMDTDSIQTAVNVIRMNLGGIGFSHNGYNGPFTTAWTIDGHFVANFIDSGTLNADIIKAGVLQDEHANTTFNLVTGALTSKNLTIDSTYFKLANDGKITSITTDGKKLVLEKGTITGYKADGTQSAKLEIGDGLFNIVGKLALNGVVGVSGSTSFVKSISSENITLADVSTQFVTKTAGATASSSSVSGSLYTNSTSVYFNGTATVDGKTGTCSGTIAIPSMSVNGNLTAAAQTISLTSVTEMSGSVVTPIYNPDDPFHITGVKSVSASTGAINSSDGLIQSIS